MTFTGRNVDILVGLTAPIVAYFCFVRRTWPARVAWWWNWAGVLVLLNVVVHAQLSAPTRFRVFATEPATTFIGDLPYIWLPRCSCRWRGPCTRPPCGSCDRARERRRRPLLPPRVRGGDRAPLLAAALFVIVRPFLDAILWSMLIAFLLHPAQRALTARLRGRVALAAILLTLFTAVVLIAPGPLLAVAFASQARSSSAACSGWWPPPASPGPATCSRCRW